MAITKLADITLAKQSGTTLTLNTEGKYVASDVQFGLSAKSATIVAGTANADVDISSTDSSSIGGVNISASIGEKATSEPTSGYYICLIASGSGRSQVSEAGWVGTGSLSAASTTATKYFPITAATITQNAPTIANSTGVVTATVKTTAGYTPASNTAATNTLQLTTKAAETYNTSTSNQTISANRWLTGAQTIRAVTTSNIDAANIKDGVNVLVGDAGSSGRIKNVTGTFTDASTVSNGQTAAGAGNLVSGYSAWVDGEEVQGSIPIRNSLSVSGDTITATAGYYGSNTSASVAAGAYSADSSASSNSTVTPSVSFDTAANTTYGFTDTVPSGTSGTNYITINPGASATAWSVTPRAKITTAGYLAKANKDGTAVTNTPTIADGANYYVPVASPTFSGGGLTTNTNANSVTTVPEVTVSSSGTFKTAAGYGVTTTKPSGTDGTNYLTIDGSGSVSTTGVATSTVKVTRAAATYTNTPGVIAAHSATQAIESTNTGNITKTINITPTVADNFSPLYIPITQVNLGTTTINSSDDVQRGIASWTKGAIAAGSIPSSWFSNSPQEDTEYIDISNTEEAPTLSSGGYLYINQGYTDNLKISLAKLIQDDASPSLAAGHILAGYTAYNNAGVLITGSIPTKTSANMTVNGKTVTAPAGYYATAQSKSVADGAYSADADSSLTSNSTVTPSVGLDSAATSSYGFTTTKPSGTSGTNFLTIDPGATATAWSVTPRANITTAGYIATGSTNGTAVSNSPTVANGTNYYVPIVSNSFSGGGISIPSGGNYSKADLALTLSDGAETNMSNVTVGSKDTTTYPYYFKVNGSTPAVSGKTKATRAAATYSNSAGAIAAHNGTQIWASSSVEPTVSVNATSNSTYVGLKQATIAGSSTNATATTTVAPGNVTIANNEATVSGKTRINVTPTTTSSDIGTYYVAVKATAAANSTGTTSVISGTGSATVTAAGYAPTTLTGSVSVSGTATAKTSSKDSSVYYLPLSSAGVSYSGGGLSNTASYTGTPTISLALDSQSTSGITITDDEQSSGYYVKLIGSTAKLTGTTTVTRAAYTDTRTAGWLPARSATTVLDSTTSSPSVTVNANSKTRYLKLPTATFAKDGAKVYCSAGGWVPAGSSSSPVGTISDGTITPSTTLPSGSSSSGTITRGTYIKIGAGYYGSDKYYLAQNVSNGTITSNTTLPSGSSSSGTINRGNYIKIGAGYYGSDTYYMAQTNSGNYAVTSSGTGISVDGKATISVPAATPSFDGGALSGGSTASGINVTLSTTDNGMKIQTAYTAHRDAVLYNGAVSGWVSVSDNATALAAADKASTNGTAYYVTAVTMPKDKGFTVTTTADTELDTTSDLDITNNAYRRVDITNAANGTVIVANSGNTIVSSGSSSAGSLTVSAYNGTTAENNKSIVSGGKWVSTSASGSGTYYGRVSVSAGSATTPATTITANPTVNIDSSGLITATTSKTQNVTPSVSAGYVSSGTAGTITVTGSGTKQLTTKGATTYTPGTANQSIASGTYLTGTQTISGDANLVAANIRDGKSIFGVAGSFTDSSTVSSGQNPASASVIRSGYSAWVDGTEVKGSLANTSVTEGVTVLGNTPTRGTWSQTAGYTAARTIGAAVFGNSVAENKTESSYVDISSTSFAPVLVSGSYLYINKGYTDDVKISLAKLVPDAASANLASGHILSGYSAYNNDGTRIAGNIQTLAATDVTVDGRTITIPTQKYTGASGATAITKSIDVGSVTSGTASITSLTKTYNSSTGKFAFTAQANVSAPTVGTAGYISSSEGTKNAKANGASVNATIDKIVATTAITGTTTTKPVISKQGVPSGVTNAASGNATTTQPSSGVYVAVQSAANTGILTATPSVTTAGYGDATNHGITGNTATVGANASDITYVPITTTTASVSGKSVTYGTGWITGATKSVADGTVTNNTTLPSGKTSSGTINRGNYIKIGEGWHTEKYYLAQANSGTLTITASGETNCNGYEKVNVGAGTITNNTSGGTSAGTINRGSQIKIGKGYYNADSYYTAQSNSGTKTITASGTISVDGYANIELAAGSITNNTTLPSGTSSSGTINRGSYIKISAGYHSADKYYLAQNVSNGTITNNTTLPSGTTSAGTINRGSYIKIGAGYYSADTYYLAQANSGTKTITSSGNSISVDGYANVSVTAATPAFDGGTLSGGSTASFTNVATSSTDNGIKVQTAYTANSTAVLYNGAVAGWVSVADNTQALAAQSKTSTNGTAYYVTGITVPKDKGFTVTTTEDTALDTTSDLDITNKAYRRVDISNQANGKVIVTGAGTTEFTSGSTTTGNLTVSAYNASGTAETGKSIVTNGKWEATNVSAAGTYYGRITVASASPSFDGGELSGGSTASFSNVTTSSTDNGIKVQTAYTAHRNAVLYNGTVAGYVSVADNTSALAATDKASTNGTAYYITGITVPVDKPFTVTTTADTAFDTTSYLTITNNNYRTVNISNNTLGLVNVTGGVAEYTSGGASSGALDVKAYNASGTLEASQNIVAAGKWVTTTVNTGGTYYGKVVVPNPNILELTVSASSSTSTSISNSAITANHVVLNDTCTVPANVSYTTSAGSISLSCASGIPAMTLYLAQKVV